MNLNFILYSSNITQQKENIVRIRDNRRRSPVRRKRYLQELGAKLRQHELEGVNASTEIQVAARRVADENRKLRRLLAQYGVGENAIDVHLRTPTITNPTASYRSTSLREE